MRAKPLDGVRVLDLTRLLPGAMATLHLADMGADVVKVEDTAAGDYSREMGRVRDGVSDFFRLVNRNKRAIRLDLKQPQGREVFLRLAKSADVLVESFRPGVMTKLGLGYETISAINPRIVYCSISGYGADHTTNGSGKAMDTIIQALSGLMMTSGAPADPPVRVGVPFADLVAPVFAVVGLLAALRQRDATGVGQQVDVSMLGVLTSLVAAEPFDLLEACGLPQRTGRMVPRLTPFGVYRSADGYISICAPTEQFARGVFAAIGRPDLESDPRFATRDARVANMDAVNGAVESFTRDLPTSELVTLFERHGVPAASVRSPADAVRDPRVLARGETVPLEHPALGRIADVIGPGVPIRFSAAAASALRPAPEVGQDNALVYGDWLGYGAAKLERLRAAGNI